MMCGRCGGLMVVEPIYDATGFATLGHLQEARCINCGNVEDAVICTNRLAPQSTRNVARHNIGVDVNLNSVKSVNRRILDDGSRRYA